MEIRKTRIDELDKVMEIYARARKFMAEHNNPNQWKYNKPSREQIEADILAGKHHICEECLKAQTGNISRNKLPSRKPETRMRVLALDAATGITGYAIFDDKKLTDYGTYSANEFADSTGRINDVKQWLLQVIEKTKPDAIGIENIQYQKNVKNEQ